MNEWNESVKIAVLRILYDLLNADEVIRESEVSYLEDVAVSFGLATNYKPHVLGMSSERALDAVRELSIEQKQLITKLMGKMIVIDEDIHYNEVKLYNSFCRLWGLEGNLDVYAYPECSFSGFDDENDYSMCFDKY